MLRYFETRKVPCRNSLKAKLSTPYSKYLLYCTVYSKYQLTNAVPDDLIGGTGSATATTL